MDGRHEDPISNLPSQTRVVGGRDVSFLFSEDREGIVFVNGNPTIKQEGGALKKLLVMQLGRNSKFTHIDSCFFYLRNLGTGGLDYEVDGFMRSVTWAFDFEPSGGTEQGLKARKTRNGVTRYLSTWVNHGSSVVINATHPVGDGSGSYFVNATTTGAGDYTPIHIINGRGITVGHFGSEYTEWADPLVQMENCVECAVVAMNPGGRITRNFSWTDGSRQLDDGTIGYAWLAYRYGWLRIGGMNNTIVGGETYVSGRFSITGSSLPEVVARDPYLSKWNPVKGTGINYAPPLRLQGFRVSDPTQMNKEYRQSHSYVANRDLDLSGHALADSTAKKGEVKVRTDLLKPKSVKPGIRLFAPYVPRTFPEFDFSGGGPGVDMTGKSGKEIADVVNAIQVVYLGEGIYEIPTTVRFGTIYGAGPDKTVLKFKHGMNATEDKIRLYNLTIEGGDFGYSQQYPTKKHNFTGWNVEFRKQKLAGIRIMCSQNSAMAFLRFRDSPTGITGGSNCGSDKKNARQVCHVRNEVPEPRERRFLPGRH